MVWTTVREFEFSFYSITFTIQQHTYNMQKLSIDFGERTPK